MRHCLNCRHCQPYVNGVCPFCGSMDINYAPKTTNAPKRLNVYDAVNRERLLGTHPRWSSTKPYQRWAAMPRLSVLDFNPGAINCIVDVNHVSFDRVTIMRDGGWEAEVALVTYSPLKDLMKLRDFRLPGETDEQRNVRYYY